MAGKALNKKNLLELGADTLADLLLEAVKGDAARQRRVRMALSADLGPEAITAEVRKRFASNRHFEPFLAGIDCPRISGLPGIQRYRRDNA